MSSRRRKRAWNSSTASWPDLIRQAHHLIKCDADLSSAAPDGVARQRRPVGNQCEMLRKLRAAGQAQTRAGGGYVANHARYRAAAHLDRCRCGYGVPRNAPSFVDRTAIRGSCFDHAEDSNAFRTIVGPDIVVRGTRDNPVEDHGRATASTDRACGLLHARKLAAPVRISYPHNYRPPGVSVFKINAGGSTSPRKRAIQLVARMDHLRNPGPPARLFPDCGIGRRSAPTVAFIRATRRRGCV
jgi:hypothetical protein